MSASRLSIGFLLLPDFTMLALAGFLDTLRLAADEGDRSRPIDCRWTVMSENGRPVRASNGVEVRPDRSLGEANFDYLVVVGGTLHGGAALGDEATRQLRQAAERVPLIGICTGGFTLARAGLMQGRRCCVSWFHKVDFETEFPAIEVVADQLFVADRDRITCAGGTSVVHLASWLVERHVGAGRADKGLRIMLEGPARPASTAQPLPTVPGLDGIRDNRVRRAMLLIERRLTAPDSLAALAREVGTSPRHLARLFAESGAGSPAAFRRRLRLDRARALLTETALPVTEIALRCGFSDAPHLARAYRAAFGIRPRDQKSAVAPAQAEASAQIKGSSGAEAPACAGATGIR